MFHHDLGMSNAKQGEDPKAIAAMKIALALDPTFERAADARRLLSELQIHNQAPRPGRPPTKGRVDVANYWGRDCGAAAGSLVRGSRKPWKGRWQSC